jgi:transcriptional regulator with XRE-family HTH domain
VRKLDSKEIGKKVRMLRKARHLRQDDLCIVLKDKKTGEPLSRGQVSNLETGKRNFNIYQIKALADFFNVSLEALGVASDELEINDLLARTRSLFKNEDVPMEEKRELYEEVMRLYIEVLDKKNEAL